MHPQTQRFPLLARNHMNAGSLTLGTLTKRNYPPALGGMEWPPIASYSHPTASWILNQCGAVLGPALTRLNWATLSLSEKWQSWRGTPQSFSRAHRKEFGDFADRVLLLRREIFQPVLGPGAFISISPDLEWPLVPLGDSSKSYDVSLVYKDIAPTDLHLSGQFKFTQDVQENQPAGSWGIILDFSVVMNGPIYTELNNISSSSSMVWSSRSSSG